MIKLIPLGTVAEETKTVFFRNIKDGAKALNPVFNKWCYLSDLDTGAYLDAPPN